MKISKIYKRDGRIVPFDQEKITIAIYKAAAAVGGHNRKLSEKLSNKVVKILENNFPKTIPTVEEIQDLVEKVLIEEGHTKTAKAYILYRHKRKELREKKEQDEVENIPYKKIWQILVWNVDHQCETIDKLNAHIKGGTLPELIKAADKAYEKDVNEAASSILNNKDKIKLIIIVGPSSSGKTTTTAKLAQKLKARGIDLVALNIDNYFFNLELHPKDGYGDSDFETPEALDLNLINKHLALLLDGKSAEIPRYDFKTGRRLKETDTTKLKPGQVLLIDTLHGLYEPMTEAVPRDVKFKLYIETLSQLRDKNNRFVRWYDIRMLRRMVRDVRARCYNPLKTVGHWHYVRRAELKHIVPFISQANYIVNGALVYDLPVLKHYLFSYFPDILKTFKGDEKRQDAYIRANRVYKLLSSVEEADDTHIAKDSLIREFIGDSIYNHCA